MAVVEAPPFQRSLHAPPLADVGMLPALERRLGLLSASPRSENARIAFYVVIGWVIPMILGAIGAAVRPERTAVPWMYDFDVHARGLVGVPLLIHADRSLDSHLTSSMRELLRLRIVRGKALSALTKAVDEARSLAGSPFVDAMLVVATVLITWRLIIADPTSTLSIFGYRVVHPNASFGGGWELFVAVPLYIFLVFRWGWRWVVLTLFLYRIAKRPLHLVPTHGDRAGGIGFVSELPRPCAWVILAVSTVATGNRLDGILYEGAPPNKYYPDIESIALFSVLTACAPLLVFILPLMRLKVNGLRRYGRVVMRHGREVGHQWLVEKKSVGAESSSMGDLLAVYMAIRQIRVVPVRNSILLLIMAAALAPTLPVLVRIKSVVDLGKSLLPFL
jgi:hypothetical protein